MFGYWYLVFDYCLYLVSWLLYLVISFYNVTKIYPPGTVALTDITCKIKENEFVCIAGRSGAGKTTLLRLLICQEKPTRGRIFFEGRDVARIKGKDLPWLRQKIGIVFQDYKLLDSKTVIENLRYVMEAIGFSNNQISKDIPQVLDIVDLKDQVHRFPCQLSGGELQRAAIARALIHRPKIILADEPTGNLDPYHTRHIAQILSKINELGTTVVLATHSKELINSLGKRVISLERGKIIKDEEPGRFIL